MPNDPTPPEADTPADAPSRRDFLRHVSAAGAAVTVGAPLVGMLAAATARAQAPRAPTPPALDYAAFVAGMRWRMLGPFRGGRCAAAAGVPGRPNEFYFGHANGGVWKTTDAGRTWFPVFDGQPVASIGALAVAPSAPDVLYVGTGESTLRDSAGYGNGVYKSTDGGRTWRHLGLDATQHIGKIAVHPTNPDVVFVAAIGQLYAANPERGVYRSTDGGRSWARVLSNGPDVGAVEVVVDPRDPRVVYAGLWNTRRPPWFTYAPTNGPGGGVYKSTDGGTTWTRLAKGLPAGAIGRTGIAVAPSDPRRVYAVVDCLDPDPAAPNAVMPNVVTPNAAPSAAAPHASAASGAPRSAPPMQGGVFRSDDAGATWTRLSADPALWGRGWYFSKVTVDPRDADVVYVPNVAVNRSTDGGRTWAVLRGSPGGDDYHQAWVSPDDPATMIVASDQGAVITHAATAPDPASVTWSSWLNQPTAQLYHIDVDYRTPYWVTGAQQDSGAVAVRSRGKFAELSTRDWEPAGAGGESGYTAGDPLHPGVIYGGTGTRYDLATNTPVPGTTSPVSAESTAGRARADWTQPLVLSKADPRALYYASQHLYRSTDGAQTWTRVSPDLTRPDPGVPATLDATAAAHLDRNGKRGVIYTIAPSPVQAPLVWVGTDDGRVLVTDDVAAAGGAEAVRWRDVTPPALTAWSRVTMVEASHFAPGAAYASVDRHQLQDFAPYVYRTRDGGRTWTAITRGMPAQGYVHVVREDPARRGLLVAGTERGAFVSFDDGERWLPLQLGLPVTSVRDFVFHGDDLVVGTHGRGIWVLEQIAALRQVTDAVLAADAHLFRPADLAYLRQGGENGTPLQKDEPQAPNGPNGVALDYYLRGGARGPVTLAVVDAAGRTLRRYTSDPAAAAAADAAAAGVAAAAGRPRPRGGLPNVSPLWRPPEGPAGLLAAGAGLHRVVWDPVGPVRRPADDGDDDGEAAPLYVGTFTARLTVDGRTYEQPFTVRPAQGRVGA